MPLSHTTTPLSLSARRAWIEITLRCPPGRPKSVALRKESVDRNANWVEAQEAAGNVALRKESVDRNTTLDESPNAQTESLSARRAWIEIADALVPYDDAPSLSARRAWIEITTSRTPSTTGMVALRKESVDRNDEGVADDRVEGGRSPQGERG